MKTGVDSALTPIASKLAHLADHQLVGSVATYQTLVDSLPLCLVIKGLDGRRLFANQTYLDYRGCQLEDILGKHDSDLFPADVAQRFTADDNRVLRTGESYQGVEETVAPDGTTRWIERFKCPLRDESGQVRGLQLLFWDITAKKVAELNRDRERQLLQGLLDHMPDSIYFKDTQSHFIRVSKGMAEKFGIPNSNDVIGLTDADIFTPEHAEAARRDELKIMQTGQPMISCVERETWPDRPDTWCSSTKVALQDAAGNIIGTFGISRDITDLKQTEEELARARDDANRANRAKSDFLANMSHEIRTPMNAIIGMSELLSRTSLNRDQRDFLELVRGAADSLLRLLNDILDLSKIEASKLELEQIPFSIRECLGKTGQTLSLRAAERGLELACRVAPDIPDRLIGDPGRLRQVLINLIGNAIKFTERGEVYVNVVRDPQLPAEDHTLWLQFSVRDTGIGIPADKQASVLEAFTQADSSTTRKYGGTGLGLTISAQLAQLMGGRLWLESEIGAGTTFFFTAQLEVAPSQSVEHTSELTNHTGLEVLVVDDNATNRRILKEILLSWRMRPVLVASGQEAIQAIELAAANDSPYRLAILDCMMPEMDGFGLAEWIRGRFNSKQTRLIILSSATRVGDSERCERVGIARYLTKPVIQSELLDAVLQVMSDGQSIQVIRGPAQIIPCRPLRVLLAEDGLANKLVAKGLLELGGHEVQIASDGQEAIDLWERETFDVILMDMHMPDVDGLQATAEIRRRESVKRCRPIPIIAITAAAMPEDTRQCMQAGMNAFIAKPLQPELLYKTLAEFAAIVPASDVVESSVVQVQPPVIEQAATAAPSIATPSREVVDLDEALKRIPGGMQGLRRLCDVFSIECSQLLTMLADAIQRSDAGEVQRISHTMKGSAKLFSAGRVSAVAFEIEQRAKVGSLTEAPRLYQILRSEVAELQAALDLHLSRNAAEP